MLSTPLMFSPLNTSLTTTVVSAVPALNPALTLTLSPITEVIRAERTRTPVAVGTNGIVAQQLRCI